MHNLELMAVADSITYEDENEPLVEFASHLILENLQNGIKDIFVSNPYWGLEYNR